MCRVSDPQQPQHPDQTPPQAQQPSHPAGMPAPNAGLATAALGTAIGLLVIELLFRVVMAAVISSREAYLLLRVLSPIEGIVIALLAIAAGVLGAIVLVRRLPGRARAGIAVGIAACALWGVLLGALYGVIVQIASSF